MKYRIWWYQYLFRQKNRSNTPKFNLKHKKKYCKICQVIDAETCLVIFRYYGKSKKWSLRLDGYSSYTPQQIISQSLEQKQTLYPKMISAKQFLEKLVVRSTSDIFKLHITGFDKTGQLLGYLYYYTEDIADTVCLNDLMIVNGHGTKSINLENKDLHR